MKILIIGAGGREHALVWKLKQSSRVDDIYITPGNAGTGRVGSNLGLHTKDEIISWAEESKLDLVIVGPDDYLAEGIVNDLQEKNIPVFGPTKEAAEIEWSKAFAKEFMKTYNIPTANYETFTNSEKAREYVLKQSCPIVIKASGLALGKGVIIAETHDEACVAIDEIMDDKIFGSAGSEVVIEEYLVGKEISTHAFCDGEHVVMFPSAQDRKRAYDNDCGPNTGGMGTIAPVPGVTDEQLQEIKETIIMPTIRGLHDMGRVFKGALFPGIMLTENGPKVIEFNARFGDPETQSYMRLLETDLIDIILSCIDGTLDQQTVSWSVQSACCVVVASGGYPGLYEKGKEITGLDSVTDDAVEIFHAGTTVCNDAVVTNGGRVLGVTSIGKTLPEALQKSYKTINLIHFDGKQFRTDIGS